MKTTQHKKSALLCLAICFVAAPQYAVAVESTPYIADEALKDSVINQTYSQPANDFYRAFVAGMEDSGLMLGGNPVLSVKEIRRVSSGTMVSVENGKGTLVQLTLYAGNAGHIQRLGNNAATIVREKLAGQMLESKLTVNPDLGRSDLD